MARNTQKPASQRVQVRPAQNVGRYSVVAPGPGSVTTSAGQTAKDLAEALGVVQKVSQTHLQRQNQADALAGTRDFNLGNVNEEFRKKSKAYDKAVTQNETEAGWIEDVSHFDQKLRELDLESLPPDQQVPALNASIDKLYKEQYQGLKNQDSADVLIPLMKKYREHKVQELVNNETTKAHQRIDANLQTVVRAYAATAREQAANENPDVPDHLLSASKHFDYQGLHDRIRALKPGAETNKTYFEILKDTAIRTGDPQLIENIPMRWSDGTPSFRSIPGWDQKILSAEHQARSEQEATDNEYRKQITAEQKQHEEEVAAAGYEKVFHGVDPTSFVMEQVAGGFMKGHVGNSIVQAFRSSQNYSADNPDNPKRFADLQARVLIDPQSVAPQEIMQAQAEGVFGDPQQNSSLQTMREMLKDRAQSIHERHSVTSPRAKSLIERFKIAHEPKKSALGVWGVTAAERLLYADSLDELHRRITNGENPAAAYGQVETEYLNRRKDAHNLGTLGSTEDIDHLKKRVDHLRSTGMSARNIIVELNSAGVDAKKYNTLLNYLNNQQQ